MKQDSILTFIILLVTYAANAQNEHYSLEELLSNEDSYLSSINEIKTNTNNNPVFTGTKGKEKIITGRLISEIIKFSQMEELYPECVFDHTLQERETYLKFRDEFVRRPNGFEGARAASNWKSSKIYQNVNINVDRNTMIARYLYDADIKLKKLIMGRDLMHVRKLKSFAWFVEFNMHNKLEENSGYIQNNYETIFYLVPDTIITRKSNGSMLFEKLKFKMMALKTYKNIDNHDVLENKWADEFNKSIDIVVTKHKELSNVQEVFKLYFLLKNYFNLDLPLISLENIINNNIPERINAFKICKQIVFPDSLINEPARYRFSWLLISGAITFNYKNAIIKSQ